jgi:uncharacterized protein YrrD
LKVINQHLGLPVIALDTSERVGDVIRFVTDQVSGAVLAVAVSRQWYAEPAGVLFRDCTAFGQNVVLVSSVDALKPLSQMDEVRIHLEASNDARQRTAITESGRLLGAVTDEAFDEKTGLVNGYRLDVFGETGGSRSVYVSRDAFVTGSATVAILRDDVLDHSAASLDALASIARPDAPAVTMEAPAKEEEAAPAHLSPRTVEEPVSSVPASALAVEEEESPGAEPETATPEEMEAQERVMSVLSVGKTAAKTVTAADGTVIVEAGQTITEEIAEAAKAASRLYEVWISAQG